MTQKRLENAKDDLKISLYDVQFDLREELLVESDGTRIAAIEAEIETTSVELRKIVGKEIKTFTEAMKNDPQIAADVEAIKKATKKASAEAKAVKNAADKLAAATKAIEFIITPVEKLLAFFA